MNTLSAYMIVGKNETEWIRPAIASMINVVDEFIIVEDTDPETLAIIDEFECPKLKVYHKKWHNHMGIQRSYALSKCTMDWVFQYDADEVVGDNAYLFKEKYIQTDRFNAYFTRMVHFIRDLAHVDSTIDKHYCHCRLFKRLPHLKYSTPKHSLLEGFDHEPVKIFKVEEVITYHLGGLKNVKGVCKKHELNLKYSRVIEHTPEFLLKWRNDHLFGTYPVKDYKGPYPSYLMRELKL